MHSTVYELSDHPIPKAKQITPGYLPDWFFWSICNYATTMADSERKESIQRLSKHLGNLCVCNGEQLTFSPNLKQMYFLESHHYFQVAALALAKADYESFAGIKPAPALGLALNGILESYEDKNGYYIYSHKNGELMSLDHWLRVTDLSKSFYFGGTIEYYY